MAWVLGRVFFLSSFDMDWIGLDWENGKVGKFDFWIVWTGFVCDRCFLDVGMLFFEWLCP